MTEKIFINRRGQQLEGLRKKGIMINGFTVEKEYVNVVEQTIKATRGDFYVSQVYCFSFASNCNILIARAGSFGTLPGPILRKCWTGNGAIRLVDFSYWPAGYLSRVIMTYIDLLVSFFYFFPFSLELAIKVTSTSDPDNQPTQAIPSSANSGQPNTECVDMTKSDKELASTDAISEPSTSADMRGSPPLENDQIQNRQY